MRLLTSPASPYARKVRLVSHEKGLTERIEEVNVSTRDEPDALIAANPMGRVPTLVMDNGASLYDSRVICEALDSLGSGPHLIPQGTARLSVLQAQALGDGICDSAVMLRKLKTGSTPDAAEEARLGRQILRGVGGVGAMLRALPAETTLGHLALAAALGYLDYRLADLKWRDRHSEATNWYMSVANRPSMRATMPKN